MGAYSAALGVFGDLAGIVTGVALGLLWWDLRPNRVIVALLFLMAFIGIAMGVNFEIDVKNGAYRGIFETSNTVFTGAMKTTYFLDDKPAKFRLELLRFAIAALWACAVRFGIPAAKNLLKNRAL